MSPRGFRTRRPLSRAARLTKEWISFATVDPIEPECQTSVEIIPGTYFTDWIISPQAAIDSFDEPTVLRMLFYVPVAFNSLVASEQMPLMLGIRVTRDDGTGLPPFADPYLQGYEDWLWTMPATLVSPPSIASTGAGAFTIRTALWDIKSKRRIEAGEGLQFIAVGDACSPSAWNFALQGRVLLAH